MRLIGVGEDRIKVVGQPLMELKRGFLLRKCDHALLQQLNPHIKVYTQSKQYLSDYQKWYGKQKPFWTIERLTWTMSILLIVAIIGLLTWRYFSIRRLNQRLQQSENQLRTLINTMPDLVWLKALQSVYIICNSKFERFFGAKEADIVGKSDYDFVDTDLADFFREKDKLAMSRGGHCVNEEEVIYADDGHKEVLETIKTPILSSNGKLIGVLGVGRDITQRKKTERIERVRQELSELLYQGNHELLMQSTLDIIEKNTQSQIGFFHFVEDDQETISLQVWSTRTLKEMCFAEGKGLHYPVSEAGVWVDCIHQRKAVIHNDYQSLPHKKGLPKGHATLIRELTVPLINESKIVAVIGVGNKITEYTSRRCGDCDLNRRYRCRLSAAS